MERMKPILMFVFGAIGAAAMVLLLMRPADKPAEQQPVATVQQPQLPAPSETPEPLSPSPAESNPSPVASSPEPAVRPERREPVASSRPAVTPRKPAAPVQTARSTPPVPQNNPSPAVSSTPTSPAPSQPPAVSLPQPTAPVEPRTVVEEKKPTRVPQTVTIPSGTLLTVRVDQSLSSLTNQAGDSFRASLDQPLIVDGAVLAERGARIEGRVVEVDPGGRTQGRARLALELVRLNTSDGQRLRLQTDSFAKLAESDTKRDIGKVAAAAGIGAAIGAIAGGGKGAAIGAGVGGAAGTGGVLMTRGKAAEVPAETRMTFKLRDSITVTEKLP
ncbi:MAG TPA: hypothetical protein VEQ63_12640 [Bryobacteraceae bacterium]|nr:hypothetical protein [Bryobacteraceae bacterium]